MFRYTLLLSMILHGIIIWGVGWYNPPGFSMSQERENYFQVTVVTTPGQESARKSQAGSKSFKTVSKANESVNKTKTIVPKQEQPPEKLEFAEPKTSVAIEEETSFPDSTVSEMNLSETSSSVPTEASSLDQSKSSKIGQNSDDSFKSLGLIPITQGPRQKYAPHPQYPRLARKNGWEGTIVLYIEVLKNGTIGRIELDRSTGYQILDEAAIKTVKHWRYVPALAGDNPVTCWLKTPIRFQLE